MASRADPVGYLRSFQPDQPQFEALRKALIAARGGNPDPDVVSIPDGPTLKPDGSGFAFIDAPEGYEIELMQRSKAGASY